MPLWRFWMQSKKQIKFVIIANSVAVKQIEKENIKGLDWIELNSKASDFYESKSSFCQAQCMIISTRGTEMESAAIKFADKYNIPKAKIVDTWYGYNRRMFTELDEKLGSSKLLVIDERAKSEAIKSGIADSMVEIVGQPAWQTQSPLNCSDRTKVLFVSQPIEYFYKKKLGYTESKVLEIVLEAKSIRPELFSTLQCAIHPEGLDKLPSSEEVIYTRDGPAQLSSVGVVIGMFSSLMTEAHIAGLHVISYHSDKSSSEFKCVPDTNVLNNFKTVDDLIVAMQAPIADAALLKKNLENSTERLSHCLLKYDRKT